MADISIEEAKAKIWMNDVNFEIQQVERVLGKVNTALSEVAGSQDTIMDGIYKVGTVLENTWNQMCSGFKGAQEKIREAVERLVSTGNDVVSDTEALKNKAGGR